jgi:RNA polymerase sigma-70 factor (ECF subfamily)
MAQLLEGRAPTPILSGGGDAVSAAARSTEHDRARFDRLYRTHFHQILGYALRRTGTAEDAADVVSKTFLVAWRRLDAVPPGDAAKPWLYGVARNVLANQRRGQRRRARLATRLGAELAAVMGEAAPSAEPFLLEALSVAFRRLGADDREVLALMAWENLGRDEIAAVLGCSRGAARVRLHRARKRFSAALLAAGLDGAELPPPWHVRPRAGTVEGGRT